MDSKCLRYCVYRMSAFLEVDCIYRISAGFCSIIAKWAYQSLKIDNR